MTTIYLPKEIFFELDDGMRVSGKSWGEESGFPILCIHGWLDNSSS
jgi:hypothetical protein